MLICFSSSSSASATTNFMFKFIYNINQHYAKRCIVQLLFKEMKCLYAAIISTLDYSAELWPLTAMLSKQLDADDHRCTKKHIRCLLKDNIINKEIGWEPDNKSYRTIEHSQWKMTVLVRSSDMDRSPVHATASTILGSSRFQEGTRTDKNKLERHVQRGHIKTGLTWWGGGSNKQEWHRSVAQCVHMDAGWIKVTVKVIWQWIDFSWIMRLNPCLGSHLCK